MPPTCRTRTWCDLLRPNGHAWRVEGPGHRPGPGTGSRRGARGWSVLRPVGPVPRSPSPRVSRMQGRPLIRFGSMEIRSYATPEACADRSPAAQHIASAPPIAIRQTINGQHVDWRPGSLPSMSTSELRRRWARPRADRSHLHGRFRDLRHADYRVRRRLSIGQVFVATAPDHDLRKIRSGRPVIWPGLLGGP
jgi:hypothetical protein